MENAELLPLAVQPYNDIQHQLNCYGWSKHQQKNFTLPARLLGDNGDTWAISYIAHRRTFSNFIPLIFSFISVSFFSFFSVLRRRITTLQNNSWKHFFSTPLFLCHFFSFFFFFLFCEDTLKKRLKVYTLETFVI